MSIIDQWEKSPRPSRPRTRTQGSLKPVTGIWYRTAADCANPGKVNMGSFQVGREGEILTTKDVVTPDFRKRSARGEVIINPFFSDYIKYEVSGNFSSCKTLAESCVATHTHIVDDNDGPWAYRYVLGAPGAPNFDLGVSDLISGANIASAVSAASTSAWNKSAGHQADILVDIAEIGQLIRMLRDPIQSTSTFLRKIQSGRKGIKALKGDDAIAYAEGLWLQYRFGIRPLVSSVQGVVKAMNKQISPRRSTHRGSYSMSTSSSSSALFAGGQTSFNYTIARSDEVNVRTGFIVEDSVSFAQALGVDASGMLSLPWELVPYSFVADWFTNVGTFLGALVPAMTKSPLGSWTTVIRKRTSVFTILNSYVTSPLLQSQERDPVEYRRTTSITKTRTPGMAVPSLTLKPFAMKKVITDLRVVDGFALLHNLLRTTFGR